MQTAFKEWAIVVEALGRGEQIVILRKGGIAEGGGGFRAEHERFWLFPTQFHQQAEGVVPASAEVFAEMKKPAEGIAPIQFACEVVEVRELDSLEEAQRLQGQHIWREEIVAERFDWGRDKGIYAMAVRVRRLGEVVELPLLEGYGGCRSWIELEPEMDFVDTLPVLSDDVFAEKLAAFQEALA